MILKGSQRRGAVDLALHLSNEIDNEKVYVAEMRSMAADNLYDGFREWELICDQTNATKSFYSLSINPDPNQRGLSDQEWLHAINHIEKRLGLNDQPRAIIFHEKAGESNGEIRKHVHVVWSRITPELKAVHLGNDHYKLKACAKELVKEFGLELAYGNAKEKAYDHAKSHGQNRNLDTTKARKQTITKLWHEHGDKQAFITAMTNAGYVVAQGQRRAFVIIDQDGQVHALARQIYGENTKAIKARLGNIESCPSVDEAKTQQRIIKSSLSSKCLSGSNQKTDLTREQKLFQKLRRMARRADKLNIKRRRALKHEATSMALRQKQELDRLAQAQRTETTEIMKNRNAKPPHGIIKQLRNIFGFEMVLRWKHHLEDQRRGKPHNEKQCDLKDMHKLEQARLERKTTIMQQQERREVRSIKRLATKLGYEKVVAEKIKKQLRHKTKMHQLVLT